MPIEPGTLENRQLAAPLSRNVYGGTADGTAGGPTGRGRHFPQRYVFRIHGVVDALAARAFPSMETHIDGADTLLIGSLPDAAALYGVIAQVERLGLELLEINRPPAATDNRTEGDPR